VLKKGYYQAMDDGDIMDIPYLLGSTKDDILCPPNCKKEDSMLYRGAISFSKKLESLGRKPAYVYRFVHDLPGDDLGAWHSCELWYMFGTLNRCWRDFTQKDYALSERMLDYWTDFMKTGDPNGGSRAMWKPCSGSEEFVLELDV
jgi:para-nitrobenzyl esterase